MRWAEQEISREAGDPAALPGLDRLQNLVRSVRTPEFAGITFHEVLARSALNSVPKAAGLPFNWTVNPYRGCSHGCVCYPEVLGKEVWSWLGQVASLIATESLIPIRARGSSPTRHPATYPRGCLVQGAAVLDRFRCMAAPTESDLERDNTPVVRRSQTAAPRCRTSFAIRGGRLRRADFSWIAYLSKRMDGADVTRLWPSPSSSVLACLRVLSRGTR
jgi:hypothetical protein